MGDFCQIKELFTVRLKSQVCKTDQNNDHVKHFWTYFKGFFQKLVETTYGVMY